MKRKLATIYLLTHKRLEIIQTMKAEIQIQHMFMKAQAIITISIAAHENIFFLNRMIFCQILKQIW